MRWGGANGVAERQNISSAFPACSFFRQPRLWLRHLAMAPHLASHSFLLAPAGVTYGDVGGAEKTAGAFT